MNKHTSRRTFLKTAAAASAAIGMPTIIPASALGKNGSVAPSNRLVMGGIGIGPRGRKVLSCFLQQPDVQFIAIADAQEERREIVRRVVNRDYENEDCYKTRDMFEILENKDIDIVQITTGDRWHTLGTILAAKAGKDVYCEKPCSMNIKESQELADAVNKYERVFQSGTQRRNVNNFKFAAHLALSGKLGNVHTVHAGILKLKPDEEWLPEEPQPDKEECDWDLWLGPAPWRPYNKKYVQGRWRGHYDFHGGAGLPEWGSHTLDLCQWGANADNTMPIEYEYEGDTIHGKYNNGVKLVMRLSGFKGEGDWKVPGTCPVKFEGDEGWVEVGDHGNIVTSSESLKEGAPTEEMFGTDPIKHVRDFLDCVKTREKPACNQDITRRGHIACHAAAIGWQLGRKVEFDPVKEKFIGDKEAQKMANRVRRKPWRPNLKKLPAV
ncbi:Gfo/Idh/MocA family oxidoreductase [Opitutia bacterium ISCC 51]|nr:Gfo/Idh/MocA family oxidoreductase [Opitutae bacterium ISCC 51]QXD28525.1 Gfo/Idh/MocA family oxidoreductase [Opitutae bacterium ISCC 52]